MSKKVVLKLAINDDKEKKKAMKTVSSLSGIESLAVDMKDRKLTVIGDVDPVQIVSKLRKLWHTDILTVGPAKEEKKDDKKDEKKEDKKDDKKDDQAKKLEEERKKREAEYIAELLKQKNHPYYYYPQPHPQQHYRVYSSEENPNSCVIC